MVEDIRTAGKQHVAAIQAINRDLVEKAFRMRSDSYFAHVKSNLLMETITEIDRSKKNVVEYNASLVRQRDTIAEQKRELADKSEQLERLTAELERRVAERTAELARANARLASEMEASREACARAEEMARFKSAVLRNLSHEFRTPATAILLLIERLVTERDEPRRREYARRIKRSTDRLMGTLDDVLELAQLERGEIERELGRVDLAEECRAIAERLRPQAQSKGLALEVAIDREPPPIASDARIVRRILEKVVQNAIKFTRRGSVRVTLSETGAADFPLAVAVHDTGVGIAPELASRLGSDFLQGDPSSSREYEGLGIGLALVRRYVTLLGAKLDIRSVKGEGTTVSVTWPAAANREERSATRGSASAAAGARASLDRGPSADASRSRGALP